MNSGHFFVFLGAFVSPWFKEKQKQKEKEKRREENPLTLKL
jgi:hypothetical protein